MPAALTRMFHRERMRTSCAKLELAQLRAWFVNISTVRPRPDDPD